MAKETDLGENDTTYTTNTHLGHLLKVGDVVMGYDISHSTISFDSTVIDESSVNFTTDILLVKKGETGNKDKKKNNKNNNRNKKNKKVLKMNEGEEVQNEIGEGQEERQREGGEEESEETTQTETEEGNEEDESDGEDDEMPLSLGDIIQSAKYETQHYKHHSEQEAAAVEENEEISESLEGQNLEEENETMKSAVGEESG